MPAATPTSSTLRDDGYTEPSGDRPLAESSNRGLSWSASTKNRWSWETAARNGEDSASGRSVSASAATGKGNGKGNGHLDVVNVQRLSVSFEVPRSGGRAGISLRSLVVDVSGASASAAVAGTVGPGLPVLSPGGRRPPGSARKHCFEILPAVVPITLTPMVEQLLQVGHEMDSDSRNSQSEKTILIKFGCFDLADHSTTGYVIQYSVLLPCKGVILQA